MVQVLCLKIPLISFWNYRGLNVILWGCHQFKSNVGSVSWMVSPLNESPFGVETRRFNSAKVLYLAI